MELSAAKYLERWCLLANTVAYTLDGVRNTCIHTSIALAEFLRLWGLEAEVFRAEAHVHCARPDHQNCHGSTAGSNGNGTRRPKSAGWRGHLAVSCGDYVLDPTLDQLSTSCGLRPRPAVFLKPDGWGMTPPDRPWQGGAWHRWQEGNLDVSHVRYRHQVGWKSKPAARPSRWREIVELMVVHEKM
jgi:hypothetical protein